MLSNAMSSPLSLFPSTFTFQNQMHLKWLLPPLPSTSLTAALLLVGNGSIGWTLLSCRGEGRAEIQLLPLSSILPMTTHVMVRASVV